MNITYVSSTKDVTPDRLQGFFVGWPNPPSPETHLRILEGSDRVILADDDTSNKVVGFTTAITDGVISASIPHLEVLPDFQRQGIGSELVRRLLSTLKNYYAIDLICDPDVQPFYARLGLQPHTAMLLRNYHHQSGV